MTFLDLLLLKRALGKVPPENIANFWHGYSHEGSLRVALQKSKEFSAATSSFLILLLPSIGQNLLQEKCTPFQ